MGIVDTFERHFLLPPTQDCTFSLAEYDEDRYTGLDRSGRPVVVVFSETPKMTTQIQESRSLKIECNAHVKYALDGKTASGVVHVLTCLTPERQSYSLFLELADLLLNESNNSVEGILQVYHALSEFFSETPELSENELIGLYGELFAICTFPAECNLASCWQSTNRMKYDFSINETTKIEIKSTTKQQRIHRFKHEQLVASDLDIYVVSYTFQPDDRGLSLYDLINQSKFLCEKDARKILKLERIVKIVGEKRLKELRFNKELAQQNRSIYRSKTLPHLVEKRPAGISSIEYDVDLANAPCITEDDLMNAILNSTN